MSEGIDMDVRVPTIKKPAGVKVMREAGGIGDESCERLAEETIEHSYACNDVKSSTGV